MSRRLLLTSVCRPFGGDGEGDSVGAELFHAQVTRAQGAFSMRQVIRVWGLDLIAENIETPTVVLHYPSMDELAAELRTARYTHVGINFVVATFHKVRAMVELVRRVSPGTEIVLGGYGTVLPDEILAPWSDHVCREEGVKFVRRLFGEPTDRPIVAAHSPVPSPKLFGWQQPTVVGHVTAGLGCANGCDFCCTSHFFRRKYVSLRGSGGDIYAAMVETKERAERQGQKMESFALIDEDFFLQKKRAYEFLEATRRGGSTFNIFGFGSVKGLSQFTGSEISEMGFGLVWTAFEGKKSGYAKLDGRPIAELHDDLHAHGVGTLCSMIVGFPYQDEATVRAEFDELMKLEPSLAQVLIYLAFPGTPLYEEVLREERFLPEYARDADLRRWDGFALQTKHPSFTRASLEALQRELYREDYARLGASVHRLARVWLRGAQTFDRSSSPLLRKRAARLREDARAVLPTTGAARAMLSSRAAREVARTIRRGLRADGGPESAMERVTSVAALGLAAYAGAAAHVGLLQQPGLLRVAHRTGEAVLPDRTMHLQGAGRSLASRLWEDLVGAPKSRRTFTAHAQTRFGAWKPIAQPRPSIVRKRTLPVVVVPAADAAE